VGATRTLLSRHLPVLVLPGSSHRNLQITVRPWSGSSLNEDRDIRDRHPFDRLAQGAHDRRRSNQWRPSAGRPGVEARARSIWSKTDASRLQHSKETNELN
jgi:hypothetical protein